jgi:hypothetical protein
MARSLRLLGFLVLLAAVSEAGAQGATPGRPPDPIDSVRSRALAPVPKAPTPPPPGERFVPERRFYSPELGREVVVPGHYESRISDQQYVVPPLTGYGPHGEGPVLIPGGERPPADQRQGP